MYYGATENIARRSGRTRSSRSVDVTRFFFRTNAVAERPSVLQRRRRPTDTITRHGHEEARPENSREGGGNRTKTRKNDFFVVTIRLRITRI